MKTVGEDLPTLSELEAAAALVYRSMAPTPQYRWPLLEARVGTRVWVKHENYAPTGEFKVRGGLVYFDDLVRNGKKPAGVVSATRGNHGQSMGFAAAQHGIAAAVVVPHGNSVEKNAAMRALGVELIEEGHDFQAASEVADRIAEERRWHRFPNFHPLLMLGVATYALELFKAASEIDTVYVPVGMGSGVCGVIAARDALGLRTRIVAVVSAGAPGFALSFEKGEPISHDVTTKLADGMACRTPNSSALAIARRGVERVIQVTEDEVGAAMRALFTDTHNVAEGAGAAALAGLMKDGPSVRGRTVAIVLTGANVDSNVFARVIS